MWEGPFDEFIYIDVDSVVLKNIEFAFNYLDKYDCYTSHSDMGEIRKFVWKDSIYSVNALSAVQIQYAANTGFIVSRKGVFSMNWIQSKLLDAIALRQHMELNCQEQPFLNFLIVTSGKRYSSLFTIYQQSKDNRIMFEYWAGTKGVSFKKGRPRNGEPYFLVHWAGCWQPRTFDFRYYKILRFLRVTSKTANPKLHFFMPHKRLWRFYRFMNQRSKSATGAGA
jgi:lipopolysaccharide biosynthesis glycosyltransferase